MSSPTCNNGTITTRATVTYNGLPPRRGSRTSVSGLLRGMTNRLGRTVEDEVMVAVDVTCRTGLLTEVMGNEIESPYLNHCNCPLFGSMLQINHVSVQRYFSSIKKR